MIHSPAAVAETFLHVWMLSSDNSRCPTAACPSEFVMSVCSADESQLELLCPAFAPVSRNFSAFTDCSFCPWQKSPVPKWARPIILSLFSTPEARTPYEGVDVHGLHVNFSQCLWCVKSWFRVQCQPKSGSEVMKIHSSKLINRRLSQVFRP